MVLTVFEEVEILEGTETCPPNLSFYLQTNHKLAEELPSNQDLWAVLGERLTEKTPCRVSVPKVSGRKIITDYTETPLENSPSKTLSAGWEKSRKEKEALDFYREGKNKISRHLVLVLVLVALFKCLSRLQQHPKEIFESGAGECKEVRWVREEALLAWCWCDKGVWDFQHKFQLKRESLPMPGRRALTLRKIKYI